MKLDFILYCLLGIVTLCFTIFGGFISSENKVHRMVFLILGLISFTLILITGYRSYHAQIEASNIVTGGNSFGYLYISYELKGQEKINPLVAFKQEGKYPLYDVSIKIIEAGKMSSEPSKDYINKFFSAQTNIDIGDVKVSKAVFIHQLQDMLKESCTYQIHIEAKNGTWEEQFRIIKSDNAYCQAIRVFRPPNFKIPIFERVDDNFPRNKEGKIDWKG